MTAGLLLSVMGNRLVEGGYDGIAAARFIGAGTVVAVSTLGQLTVLLFPLYARFLRHWSPNTALIAADSSEMVLSGIAIAGMLAMPDQGHLWVLGYVVLALPAPGEEVDSGDYSMLGQRAPMQQFVKDLLRSGPASPLMSLFIQIAGGLTGELLMLWAASLEASSGFESMSIVLMVFGLAATAGPQLGRWLARRTSSQYVINISAMVSLSLLLALALGVWRGWVSFPIALAVIFCNVLVGRARLTVLSTHRQVWFSGRQFERIMSWSYAFGGLGTIIGLQVGYLLGVTTYPLYALLVAAVIWALIACVRISPAKDTESVQA